MEEAIYHSDVTSTKYLCNVQWHATHS